MKIFNLKILSCFFCLYLVSLCGILEAQNLTSNNDFSMDESNDSDSFQVLAYGWSDTFSIYSCSQKCGLTPSTSDQVSFSANSEYDNRSALQTFCSNRKMRLQGDMKCSENKVNRSGSEYHARCKAGNLNASCVVNIIGYNRESTSFYTYKDYGSSYNDAEKNAMNTCKSSLGTYATCITYNWYPQ